MRTKKSDFLEKSDFSWKRKIRFFGKIGFFNSQSFLQVNVAKPTIHPSALSARLKNLPPGANNSKPLQILAPIDHSATQAG
jgi:hypothetical protein